MNRVSTRAFRAQELNRAFRTVAGHGADGNAWGEGESTSTWQAGLRWCRIPPASWHLCDGPAGVPFRGAAARCMLPKMFLTVVRTEILLILVIVLVVASVVLATVFAAHAPAASVALVGLLGGGAVGFVVEAADGPKDVPVTMAVWASAGLGVGGLLGLIATRGSPPSKPTRRAAFWTLAIAPFAGAALTVSLQFACPLYVTGKESSYCNYAGNDLLGFWVSEVVFLFMACALWLAVLLYAATWQAEWAETAGPLR